MTWQTDLNDHVSIANLQANTIADNMFRRDPVRPRKTYITDTTFALIRLRRAVNRATRAYQADSETRWAKETAIKLACQLREATVLTITAAEVLTDISTLIALMNVATRMVHY